MNQTERILKIVRSALERGHTVEIDGLGVFGTDADGGYRFTAQTKPRVFIAYVEEDLALARRLRDEIAAADCSPWMDKDNLLPGQDWPRAIRRAIEISDAFVACFSTHSIAKRGPFQSELRWALRCARRTPLDETFLIPVRFDRCCVPRQIQECSQYVDLFPDWEVGVKRIAKALRQRARAGHKPGCRLIS